MPNRRGPPRQWEEEMVGRFSAGTFARIKRLLGDGESRTDFLREAVARELERRERTARVERLATWIA
jgi:hypothetical protein